MNLVSDTSPLIFITKLGYLHALKQTFELYIPEAVLIEITVKKDNVRKEVTKLVEDSSIIVDEINADKVLKSFAVEKLKRSVWQRKWSAGLRWMILRRGRLLKRRKSI